MSTKQHGDPFKTRTGKTRLGTLSYAQLQSLLEKESRPKDKAKIRNRMAQMIPTSTCTSETTNDQV